MELLISLSLAGVALFLAAGMLSEARTLLVASGEQMHDPLPGWVRNHLRADLQASREVISPGTGLTGVLWTSRPLDLAGYPAGSYLRFARVEDELHRLLYDEKRQLLGREVLLRRVVSFRWRLAAPGLVDVEVAYRRAADPSRWRVDGSPGRPAPTLETERLRVALRGRGRGVGW